MASAPRRYAGSLPLRRALRSGLHCHAVHGAHRPAVPSASRPRGMDRYHELHADGEPGVAIGRGHSPGRPCHSRRVGAPRAAMGLDRSARPGFPPGRAAVGCARVRDRYGGGPPAARRRALRGVAARRDPVCGRTHGVRDVDGRRGRRQRGGALATHDQYTRHEVSDGRRPQRRHRAHRNDRQSYSGTRRAARHVQLVLSHRDRGHALGALERSGAAAAFPGRRRLGECGRRRAARRRHAAAGGRGGLGATAAGVKIRDSPCPASRETSLSGDGARSGSHAADLRRRLRHQLDAVRRHRSPHPAHELRPTGLRRSDHHGRPDAPGVGIPHGATMAATSCSRSAARPRS